MPFLVSLRRGGLLPVLAVLLVLTLARCSGPTPPPVTAPVPAPAPAPSGPAFGTLLIDADGLRWTNLRADETAVLVPGAEPLGTATASPDGRHVAVPYRAADSSRLAVVNLAEASLREVIAVPGEAVYTAAWTADGATLAAGYYAPRGDELGPGGVMIADVSVGDASGAAVRSAGCSASKIVHAWRPDGGLVVGDGANLYVVDPDGCATRETFSLRKRHHATVAPGGQRVAYIFRDLVYDRANRAYVPDSTLFVAPLDGGEETRILGDKYRARHFDWAPDGRTLAFDVQVPDAGDVRTVSLYDLDTGQSSYLVPPDSSGAYADVRPSWSPAGERIAFTRMVEGYAAGTPYVYSFIELMSRALAEEGQRLGWAGDDVLVLRQSGGVELVPVTGGAPIPLPDHEAFVHAWPLPARL